MVSSTQLIDLFIDHFWNGEDDAIKQYIKSTLGDSLQQQAKNDVPLSNAHDDLLDFLPPTADQHQFLAALKQLQIAHLDINKSSDNIKDDILSSYTLRISRQLENSSDDEDKKTKQVDANVQTPIPSILQAASTLKVSASEFQPQQHQETLQDQFTDMLHISDDSNNNNNSYQAYSEENNNNNEKQQQHSAFLSVASQQFPLYSSAALKDLFIQHGEDMNATINTLYSIENEVSGQKWMHNEKINSNTSYNEVGTGQQWMHDKEFINLEDDFPSLGSENKRNKTSSNVSKTPILDIHTPFGGNYLSRARAAPKMPQQHKVLPLSATTMKQTTTSASSKSTMETAAAATGVPKPIWESNGDIKQFSTGHSVAEDFRAARADARDHARLRNQCFEQATRAYRAGNKALAKELGQQGRMHNEKMHALHAIAAQETFTKRNASLFAGTSSSGGGNQSSKDHQSNTRQQHLNSTAATPTIDLHGLTVYEALGFVDTTLHEFKRQGRVSKVRVVVGVGRHGNVPARLPQAIKKYLDENEWRFKEAYAGLLDVYI